MKHGQLRAIIRTYLVSDLSCGHKDLPEKCRTLTLADPPMVGSKSERLQASLEATPDKQLPKVAERVLQTDNRLSNQRRHRFEEWLWSIRPHPSIPLRIRRELARGLEVHHLYQDPGGFFALLERFWVLDTDEFAEFIGGRPNGLRQLIERHVLQNPGDWSVEELFNKLGALDASDARFGRFLEGLTSHRVQQDEQQQRSLVALLNSHLQNCACVLRETDVEGGYPVFTLALCHLGAVGRPKQLIFASSVKPDLRLRDALNNDVEIVTNEDKVLVYDRPIGSDGLSWNNLQAWWSDLKGIPNDVTSKKSLWNRLLDCLPENSPAQEMVFKGFYKAAGSAAPVLPALLPEVWLHWDPKSVRERGKYALPRFRMDFLLLLPGGHRVVIEVDGKHHYATDDGRASTERYAEMVAADRELKLAGYEVYRFGAAELGGESADRIVEQFFTRLLKNYGLAE